MERLLRVREMAKKEARQLLRDPRTRMMIFIAPIVQLVVLGYAVNTDIPSTGTYFVNHDQSTASRELLDQFRASEYFRVVGESRRPANLGRALDHGAAVIGIEIPAGFGRELAKGGPAPVQIVLDGSRSNTATVAQGYAVRIVQEFALRRAAPGGRRTGAIDLRTRAWYNPELASRNYNVPGVIGLLILMMALLLTALAVVREREDGTLDQLMVSPLAPAELLVSKTVVPALVALIDIIIVTLVAMLWFGIPLRGSPVALLGAATLYILAALGVGLLISTVSRTQQEAFMSMFLFLLPAMILSGFFFPVDSMPPVFQYLTLLNPVRHFLEIVRAIFLKGEGFGGLWPQYLGLAAIAAATLRVAVIRFSRMTAT